MSEAEKKAAAENTSSDVSFFCVLARIWLQGVLGDNKIYVLEEWF